MDLSGIAAVLALLGIPVSVLIARWQMRAGLAQAEANYRASLEAAEAGHRAALEVAEANHRSALALARHQVERERVRWLADAQRAAYTIFQNSLAQFRRCLLASDVDIDELHNAFSELHNAPSIVRQVGPDEVSRIAFSIMRVCQLIEIRVRNESRNGSPLSYEERAEIWRTQVATYRDELDEAIQRVSAALWE
ncbi:hypothetical protein ACWDUC_21215 [Streptomyces tricolor]|uniref:Secreted protein n=1 Tax=Streptomyces tricolor TaxID=68277 RepID=A0ABS9JL52_9ACTN|nr:MULTISPECIES: hypothetical protein [Streptomyces]MCG0066291.1 hypothetical protein [Streptomyces tricolor]BCM71053.1 hypothetical protein EASAB2608_06387 [Streptomyces sp. EAS-AB2608]